MELQQEEDNVLIGYRASIVLYYFLLSQKKGLYLLPVNICSVIYDVFLETGNDVHFIDIDRKTLCVDEEKLFSFLATQKCTGVLLNHTYGVDVNFTGIISKMKSEYDIVIIEDRCLCRPELFANAEVDLTLYSTGYAKMIELSYGGGYGIIRDEAYVKNCNKELNNVSISFKEKIKFTYNFNIEKKQYFLDIASCEDYIISHKKKINNIYDYYLSQYKLNDIYNYWRYNILCKNKETLLNIIFSHDLYASSHYKPLSENVLDYANAYLLSRTIINLFNDKYFTERQAEELSKIIICNIEPYDDI